MIYFGYMQDYIHNSNSDLCHHISPGSPVVTLEECSNDTVKATVMSGINTKHTAAAPSASTVHVLLYSSEP